MEEPLGSQAMFEGLAKLLSGTDEETPHTASVSRAALATAGPCSAGPRGIFPGVKVAAPQGTVACSVRFDCLRHVASMTVSLRRLSTRIEARLPKALRPLDRQQLRT